MATFRQFNYIVFAITLVIPIILHDGSKVVTACELDQAQNGCRIDNGACQCGYGCKSEYRYATRRECMDALKGRSNDVCGREPCMHQGSCIQTSARPGYRCRCEGTGFWGNRCQRSCPTPSESALISQFPYECIVI